MWEEKWQNSGAFVALFGYATEERAKGIVERIREYHLTPDGFYFLYQEPKGMKGDQEDLTYLKMSLYLYLVLGLECLEETELLDRIIQKTLDPGSRKGRSRRCIFRRIKPILSRWVHREGVLVGSAANWLT